MIDLQTLKEKVDFYTIRKLHHLGITADIAAVTLGAPWVERHSTLERTWKGADHKNALESDGLRKPVRDIQAISEALT